MGTLEKAYHSIFRKYLAACLASDVPRMRLYANVLCVLEGEDPTLIAIWVAHFGYLPASNPILPEYDGGS